MSSPPRGRVFLALALTAFPACAPTPACPTPPPIAAPAASATSLAASPEPVKQVYRFDFRLSLAEPGKAPVVTTHTLNLQASVPGELRTGKNVPLGALPPAGAPPASSGRPAGPPSPPPGKVAAAPREPPSTPPRMGVRQDVGFLLRSSFQQNGGAMLLRADAEMSALDEGGAIDKLGLRGEAPLTPGKEVLVASSEDPVSHRQLALSVTATPLP